MKLPTLKRLSMGLVLMVCAASWYHAAANVFGDGDPGNGTEDDRVGLNDGTNLLPDLSAWRNSSGTISCSGQIRGSAIILDVTGLVPQATGVFLATAAHVMVDLETGRPFSDCEFQLLALGQLPAHTAPIDYHWVTAGPFDARADSKAPEFGRNDWAFIYLAGQDLPSAQLHRIMPMEHAPAPEGAYLLVAYDQSRGAMGVSTGCSAYASQELDLGGGAWAGQLLDDCDSGSGASGGGLVLPEGDSVVLVGIRTGSHWSPGAWPPEDFPHGPPPGAAWDLRSNTNFARAIDADLLLALRKLVIRVESLKVTGGGR